MNNETASAALAKKTYVRFWAKKSACAMAGPMGHDCACCVCARFLVE